MLIKGPLDFSMIIRCVFNEMKRSIGLFIHKRNREHIFILTLNQRLPHITGIMCVLNLWTFYN